MADVLDPVFGFGTVTGGSVASPLTLLTLSPNHKNFITLHNDAASDWLFAKEASDPGPYKRAAGGLELTVCRGPQASNVLGKIIGFATAANDTSSSGTVVAALCADKSA